jgi:hypothetical protein
MISMLISKDQGSQFWASCELMYHSQVCEISLKNALLSGLTNCNLKDRIQTAIAKIDQPLL